MVRQMFSWLVYDGMSSYAIAKKLWEESILTKGDFSDVVVKKGGRGEWSPSTVRRILSSPVHKGVWYYNKTRRRKVNGKVTQKKVPESEWIAVPVAAIVDEDLWDRAQVCLAKNKQNAKRNNKRKYLLRSLVFCPCGRRWTCIYKTHLKRAYYRCPSNEAEHWRKRCPNNFSIRQEVLERAIWDTVRAFFLDPQNLLDEIERRKSEAALEAEHGEHRLLEIDTEITEIDRKLGILLDQLLNGGFVKSVVEQRKSSLMNQRAELEGEAQRIQAQMGSGTITPEQEIELVEFANQVGDQLENMPFDQKRRLLELMELRIDVISRDQVTISGVISDGLIVNLSPA